MSARLITTTIRVRNFKQKKIRLIWKLLSNDSTKLPNIKKLEVEWDSLAELVRDKSTIYILPLLQSLNSIPRLTYHCYMWPLQQTWESISTSLLFHEALDDYSYFQGVALVRMPNATFRREGYVRFRWTRPAVNSLKEEEITMI